MIAARGLSARLRTVVAPPSAALRRGMAGDAHHHAPKEYTGLEAHVRKYLPQDQHIVMGVVGLYTGMYFLGKLAFGGGSKKAEAPAPVAAAPVAASGDIPADSEEFWKWIEGPGNVEKFVESLEK